MFEVKLFDLGEGMTEGEVLHWLVQVGDIVQIDQVLVEIQTDKVAAELPSPVAGKVVEILAQKGEVVPVGSTLLKIETGQGQAASPEPEPASASISIPSPTLTPAQVPASVQTEASVKKRSIIAAPYTRKVAREQQVNIEKLVGTGKGGRITLEDVFAAVEQRKVVEQNAFIAEANVTASDDNFTSLPSTSPTILPEETSNRIPFKGRRKQIAQKMSQAMQKIPHVTHMDKVDMTELLALKERLQIEWQQQGVEQKISVVPFFLKALAVSLKQYPIFNAKLDEEQEEIILESDINIGVAVHIEEGLIVPVLKQVQLLSLLEIQRQLRKLTKQAQNNELQVSQLREGTFTISNVGPVGGMFATPIINYPEVAIMAFHQIEDQPVVRNKEIVIRTMMNISLSFDHRVADGVTAVQFTNTVKYLLEHPLQLFLRLV